MKPKSLLARLLAPTLGLVIVTMIVAAGLASLVLDRQQTARFEQNAAHRVDFVAQVSAAYLTNYDLTSLGSFASELTQDPQVAYAEFFDPDGRSMTADVVARPDDLAGLLVLEREVKDSSGTVAGRFVAGFDRAEIVAARNSQLQAVAGGMFAVLLVVAAAMAWAVRYLVRLLGGEPEQVIAVAQATARGDLSRPVELRAGDRTSVMAVLRLVNENLTHTVQAVHRNANSVATASEEIAQGNQDLSQRTEEQASALEETASSMEQLSATVTQNADNARQANQLALAASTVALEGGKVVEEVVDTMKRIEDSSKKIADIINVIDGIAFQTNILALNAAVEAARAGEQGRGFAVVAGEVRNLAQRSAEAAKEIKSLITASVDRVGQGTALVDQAGTTMQEIVASIKRVTDIMSEISSASAEQSSGVAQVSGAVSQMDQVTQQNAALVEQSAAAAESLKVQARELVRAVAVFKLAEGDGSSLGEAAPVAASAPVAVAASAAPAAFAASATDPASAFNAASAARQSGRRARAAADAREVRAAQSPSDESWSGVERRAPNRARNVTRPDFGARRGEVTTAPGAHPSARASGKTGTHEEWTEF